MYAIEYELVDLLRAMLADNVYARTVNVADSRGNTALHYAAMKTSSQMADVIQMLLASGASAAARNSEQRTPLHMACAAHTGLVDMSSEHVEVFVGVSDVYAMDARHRTPLHLLFIDSNESTVRTHHVLPTLIIQVTASDPIALVSCVMNAMRHKPKSISAGKLSMVDDALRTPLHYAACRGANICVMRMLTLWPEQVDNRQLVLTCDCYQINLLDANGNSALALAVLHKHQACTLTLLQAGANIDVAVYRCGSDDEYSVIVQ